MGELVDLDAEAARRATPFPAPTTVPYTVAQMEELLAEAWDEGRRSYADDLNPYRTA